MIKPKKRKIVFAPTGKININANDLVERLFGVRGAWLSNESKLEDFLMTNYIPGHTQLFFSELSPEDQRIYRKEYKDFSPKELEKLVVWYPQVTSEEWEAIERAQKEELVKKIKKVYGVIVPEIFDGETRIWKVVELIIKKTISGTRES